MIGPAALLVTLLACVVATPNPISDPFHPQRSVVDAHKRATGQLNPKSVPAPRWMQGPKEASSYLPRNNSPHPLAPRASPSAVPSSKPKIGIYVQVLDGSKDNCTSGFLSAELDYYGTYGTILNTTTKTSTSKALHVDISPECEDLPGPITVENGKYYKEFPYIGLVLGNGYQGEDLGDGNSNFVNLAGVAKEKVCPPGLDKAYQSTYGVATGCDNPAQYNTWVEGEFALKKKAGSDVLTPVWTNTNGSEYAVELFYTPPSTGTDKVKRNGFLMGSIVPSSGHSVFARALQSLGAGAAAVVLTALPL